MTMKNSRKKLSIFSVIFLFATFSSSALESNVSKHTDIEVIQSGSTLEFILKNIAKQDLVVNRGFSHHQNMYLVVLHENGFGTVLPANGVVGGDPSIGDYTLRPNHSVVEKVDLLSLYPDLGKLKGSVIIFWSSDIEIAIGNEEKTERMSGSKRVKIPINKNIIDEISIGSD